MKYLTQKQTTKLWSGLALAALLLTVLLWCLTSTVTFTPKQAIEQLKSANDSVKEGE